MKCYASLWVIYSHAMPRTGTRLYVGKKIHDCHNGRSGQYYSPVDMRFIMGRRYPVVSVMGTGRMLAKRL